MNKQNVRGERPRLVITGAADGIGRACALAFASLGAELILCDRDGPALQRVASATGAFARYCDVASEPSVDIFAADLSQQFDGIHLLINAAGRGYIRSLGMMRMSRALLPALRRASGPKLIVSIAPSRALAHATELFPYAGSDSAFARLSEAIALQTRHSSVTAVTIVPGLRSARTGDRWPGAGDSIAISLLLDVSDPVAVADRIADLACERIISFREGRDCRPQRRAAG